MLRSAPAATLSSHYNVISAEIFSKRCQTVFAKEASSVVVEHCYRPVTRQCLDSLQPEDGDQVAGGTFCKVSTLLIFKFRIISSDVGFSNFQLSDRNRKSLLI